MITGKFNALTYVVEADGEIVYQAGNSPLESQSYVSADDGVGVSTMQRYCEITAKEYADARYETVGEIVFCEEIEL